MWSPRQMAKSDNDSFVILFAEVWSKEGVYPPPALVQDRLDRYYRVVVTALDIKIIYSKKGIGFDGFQWKRRGEHERKKHRAF